MNRWVPGVLAWPLIAMGALAASADEAATGSPRVAAAGHLVIVGGALDPDHEAVYRAVLGRLGEAGTLGILPTASGVPEESGPKAVAQFQRYAGPKQRVGLIDLRAGQTDRARDPAWVGRLAACDGLWFTGGDQKRIVDTFRPDDGSGDTPAYAAMWDMLGRGGVIAGTSAGAAMMSDPMILWGNSHEALLLGVVNDVEDHGVGVGKGMGFFPYGIVDQHFIERGRLGRLLVASSATGRTLGYGVSENSALVVDLRSNTFEVIGDPGVVFSQAAVAPVRFERPPAGKNILEAFRCARIGSGAGFTIGHPPSIPPGEPPSAKDIAAWVAGAPRDHQGGPVCQVEFLRSDEPDSARYVVLTEHARTAPLMREAMAQLDRARRASQPPQGPAGD